LRERRNDTDALLCSEGHVDRLRVRIGKSH
jgi:hypothetical protein